MLGYENIGKKNIRGEDQWMRILEKSILGRNSIRLVRVFDRESSKTKAR